MKPRWIEVNDHMQQGYRYALVAPTGRDFDAEFRPDLTPPEMLALGVFGGKYMTDCRNEFPKSWFAGRACRSARMRRATASASTPARRSVSGGPRAGYIQTTRAAGSNGTAATMRAGGCRRGRAADRPLEGHPPSCRAASPRVRAR
jgi:hypothetical protein